MYGSPWTFYLRESDTVAPLFLFPAFIVAHRACGVCGVSVLVAVAALRQSKILSPPGFALMDVRRAGEPRFFLPHFGRHLSQGADFGIVFRAL